MPFLEFLVPDCSEWAPTVALDSPCLLQLCVGVVRNCLRCLPCAALVGECSLPMPLVFALLLCALVWEAWTPDLLDCWLYGSPDSPCVNCHVVVALYECFGLVAWSPLARAFVLCRSFLVRVA